MQKRPFLSTLGMLLAIDIVLSFAFGFLPTGMTIARGAVDVLQFVAMAITMGYVLKTILEDF